jgi:Male enhanced antigen 1 (MEA1)
VISVTGFSLQFFEYFCKQKQKIMGLPGTDDNRDIEPIRDDFTIRESYNVHAEFEFLDADENERMDITESEPEGYLRLQTYEGDEQPADDSDTSGSDEDEDENEHTFTEVIEETSVPTSSVPSIVTADSELQARVWNEPRVQDTIELNTEKTEQILKAMSKFKLPNVPAWANEVNPSELVKTFKNKGSDKN